MTTVDVAEPALRAPRGSARGTLAALAAASVLALLEIFRTSMTRVLDGHAMSLSDFAHHVFPMWITVVLASPWCAFMAARFPLRGGRTARTLLAHVAGGIAFAVIHVTLLLAIHGAEAALRHGQVTLVRNDGALVPLRLGPGLLHLYGFYALMEM